MVTRAVDGRARHHVGAGATEGAGREGRQREAERDEGEARRRAQCRWPTASRGPMGMTRLSRQPSASAPRNRNGGLIATSA